jgi:heat shock protein HtpX
MPDAMQPLLVYTRVAANVRNSRLLVALFALVLAPVLSAATVLVMPVVSVAGAFVAYALMGPDSIKQWITSTDAQLQASATDSGIARLTDLPESVALLTGAMLLAALVVVTIGCAAVTALLVWRYGARMLLRAARARPLGADDEPALARLVENLCIGAGLPMPRLYIVESMAPNAFAIGRDPEHAVLVFTRGLLALLDRREMQGVVAHELSHIGNQDTRLATMLAALVGTTSLPWRAGLAPLRLVFRANRIAGAMLACVALFVVGTLIEALRFSVSYLMSAEASAELPPFMWWWVAHAMLTPLYALFVAPLAALVIRQAVSRQREFLADADAVRLTRDPEGLALALAKIGAASGEPLRVGEGSVHLYIVDPDGPRSFLHWFFPSHPPLKERLDLLAAMGSGLPQASLQDAIAAGDRMRRLASTTHVESVREAPVK